MGIEIGVERSGVKKKGWRGFIYRNWGWGRYQATSPGINGWEKVLITGRAIGIYRVIPGGLGKWPWGCRQCGIVVGCQRGLVGTFLSLGTLTAGIGV